MLLSEYVYVTVSVSDLTYRIFNLIKLATSTVLHVSTLSSSLFSHNTKSPALAIVSNNPRANAQWNARSEPHNFGRETRFYSTMTGVLDY